MDRDFTHYNRELLEKSKKLRRDMTKQERHLWYDYMKPSSFKFYRQRPIGPYIVDFYCPSVQLVIEIDGGQHYEDEAAEYDKRRTNYLEKLGLRVIRYSNQEVELNFLEICEELDQILCTTALQ